MRVELICPPGCLVSRKTLESLETLIAEERLPIPVELTESAAETAPRIRIDGHELSGTSPVDLVRAVLSRKWMELTVPAF